MFQNPCSTTLLYIFTLSRQHYFISYNLTLTITVTKYLAFKYTVDLNVSQEKFN